MRGPTSSSPAYSSAQHQAARAGPHRDRDADDLTDDQSSHHQLHPYKSLKARIEQARPRRLVNALAHAATSAVIDAPGRTVDGAPQPLLRLGQADRHHDGEARKGVIRVPTYATQGPMTSASTCADETPIMASDRDATVVDVLGEDGAIQ